VRGTGESAVSKRMPSRARLASAGVLLADAVGAKRIDGDQKYVERAARSLAARG